MGSMGFWRGTGGEGSALSVDEESIVAARLRDLGYIE
jgi:hypothetical protein